MSSLGVTGVRNEITTDLAPLIRTIRENARVPVAVGFGISTPEQAKRMAALSDGAIVGSAIEKILARSGRNAPGEVGAFVRSMKAALEELNAGGEKP